MRKRTAFPAAGAAALALLLGSASPVLALPPVSPDHTLYGVSQFWAGHGHTRRSVSLRLYNPNRATQAVAFLVYDVERENVFGTNEGRSEVFTSCGVRVLTPHASITVDDDDFAFFGTSRTTFYTEVIAAPFGTVAVGGGRGRKADALGIIVGAAGNNENRKLHAINPELFTLPLDRVVDGQREDAIACVCFLSQIQQQNIPADVFAEFGIDCR